jgi:hypothetical protein
MAAALSIVAAVAAANAVESIPTLAAATDADEGARDTPDAGLVNHSPGPNHCKTLV